MNVALRPRRANVAWMAASFLSERPYAALGLKMTSSFNRMGLRVVAVCMLTEPILGVGIFVHRNYWTRDLRIPLRDLRRAVA